MTARPRPRPRAIAVWLLGVALLVYLMVVIGGITRLTESGLSMVRWEPISGTVPPLNDPQWQAEFAAYKAYPEYRKHNRGMSLAEFKSIFFWEYLHRLIGRLIGLAFALPLLWFWLRRAIPPGYGPRLVALLALGGLQGAIGWWMVASGLVDRPDVSHIRLAVHLLTALTIIAGLLWTALDLLGNGRPARMPWAGTMVIALLAVQLLLGAFTAGLDAGFAFPTWPLMGDRLFPAGVPLIEPHWLNLIYQPVVIQFVHRWWAFVVGIAALGFAWRHRKALRGAAHGIAAMVVLQILLGIGTLTSGVEIGVAVAHQAGGVALLLLLVWGSHRLGRPKVS